jgi:DNA-binding transcriptional LysR family regulator
MSVFVAVAEEAGFAPAARRLGLSPPSVTRAVSELEHRLGVRLFHRTTRSVRLTDTGGRYLADCQRILTELEEADRHAAGIHAAPQGMVMVSASALFGRLHVAPILLDLFDQFPGISFTTLFVDRIVHLIEEGVDVAVRIADLPDSSFSAIRVGSMRRVVCASPSYLAEHGHPERPSDLTDHETINSSHMALGGEWTFGREGQRQGVKLNSRLTVNNADTAIAAATSSRGITRVLCYMIAPQLAAGDLEIILEEFELPAVPVHVLHKEASQTSARVRAVVDYLAEQLRKEPVLAAD